jgi:chaperonin cofactor prefoldin
MEDSGIHENFKVDIQEWDRLNNQIKEFEVNLKRLRDAKKELQEINVKHMVEHEIDVCNLGNGKVILKKTKSKVSVTTKENLPKKIKLYYMNEEHVDETIAEMKAEKLVDFIHSDPEYKESYTLTRSKTRNSDD